MSSSFSSKIHYCGKILGDTDFIDLITGTFQLRHQDIIKNILAGGYRLQLVINILN